MKTSRRKFLKWSGMGALGAVVFGGCGIPERELLVESPSRLPEDLVSGLEAWYATSCGQCGAGEGIIVRVIEGRAIKIEGNPDHPINRGKTSVRCQAGLQALYNPDRITTPKRLTGARGSGQYEDISWDEALNDLAGTIGNRSNSSSVLVTEPLRATLGMVVKRFANSTGARHMAFETFEKTVLRASLKQVFGMGRLPDFDLEHADYVLNFGADFLSTWLSPVRYSRGYGEFRQGGGHRGTFVHVEPRLSMTAASADRWIFVRPGREGDVAMSIAYVLMADYAQSIDTEAADALTGGQGAGALASFSPESVAETTGVPAETIRRLAGALVEHEHSLVLGGGPAAATSNGLYNLNAIYSLNHLLENVGREGGIIPNPAPALEELASDPAVAPARDWQSLVSDMRAGEVSLVMVHNSNPVYGLPASLGFADALGSVDTVVSFSSVMDETTAMADLILPDHVYLEGWGDDVPDPGPGYQTVTFQQPVVRQFGGTRPFGDTLLDVARRAGVDAQLPWPSMKAALQETAQGLHGLGRGSVQASSFDVFWNTVLQRGGWWDLNGKAGPIRETPPALPTSSVAPEFDGPSGPDGFYVVPFASNALTDGSGANLPWLQGSVDPLTTVAWRTWMEINHKKAAELGIKEGDEVEIELPGGTIRALAYPHPGVSPEVACIPTGQGHTRYGDFEVGPDSFRNVVAKGRGANVLSAVSTRQVQDTGALAWAGNRATVRKTGQWVRLPKFETASLVPTFEPVEEIIPVRPEHT